MSPVLPLSASFPTDRRRLVRRPAVRFLPFCPETPDSTETEPRAPGELGWRKRSLEQSTADCPPPSVQTPLAPLVGIARLAANAPEAQTKRTICRQASVFPVAGEIDPESMRFGTRAI